MTNMERGVQMGKGRKEKKKGKSFNANPADMSTRSMTS